MVIISIDVDWAPLDVISDTVSLLDKYNVAATFFMTDKPDYTYEEPHEVSIHPNFRDLDKIDQTIEDLMTRHPGALGCRSHTLLTGGRILESLSRFNIAYCSNYMMIDQWPIKRLKLPFDLIEYPIYFADVTMLRLGEVYQPSLRGTTQDRSESIMVFEFHPIHIYLNTPTIDFYNENKQFYQTPEELYARRYVGVGVRTVFENLLKEVSGWDCTFRLAQRFTSAKT